MSNLNKMKRELFLKAHEQRNNAWDIKDFDKAAELRKEEQKTYDKYILLDGIIKASEKGKKNVKNGQR